MYAVRYLFFFSLLFITGTAVQAQNVIFAQLQGSPVMNTSGWNLTGAATIGDTPGDADGFSNELVLIPPVNTTSGAVFYSQPIDPSVCTKWTVDFEFRIFDGNGADGIAFCFLTTPPVGFVVGAGVGIPAAATGLKVVFDTFDNGCGANPEVQLYNGTGYDECIAGIQKVNNTAGNLDFIRSNNYNSARIVYDNGFITVSINNVVWLNNINSPINFTGYMGFTSGSGAFNDRHSLRNVVIYAEMADADAGPDVAYCSGDSVQIGTVDSVNYNYSWSPATGLSQTNISNPFVHLVNNGNTPVTQVYTVTTTLANNPTACPQTDAVTVTVNPVPVAGFAFSAPQTCQGQNVGISYTGNMSPAATYAWNFDGGIVVSGVGQGPYQVHWPDTGMHTVTLTVSQYGCSSTLFADSIRVYEVPTGNFSIPAEICIYNQATVTYTGTGTPAAVYTWNFDSGTIVSGSNEGPYDIQWSTPGTKILTLSVTENGCVSPPYQDTLIVRPKPAATFAADTQICANANATLTYTGAASAAANYAWLYSGGSPQLNGGEPQQIDWTAAPGSYYLGLQVTEFGCISDTVLHNITVYPVPTATFTVTPAVCTGEAATLTYTGTASAAAQYNWTVAPGLIQSGSGQGPLQVSYANAGNPQVILTVTENNCISAPDTQLVVVHPIPTSDFNVAAGICAGQTSILSYTGTAGPGAQYNWDFNGVQVVSGNGQGPYTLGDAVLGSFNISLQVTENNCVSPVTTHPFVVLPSPVVDFTAAPLIGCNPLPVQFTNNTTLQPGIQYQWSFGTGDSSAVSDPLYTYLHAGSFSVTLYAENAFGCSDQLTRSNYINVTPHPEAGFTVTSAVIDMDNPTVHIINEALYAETWFYDMGEGTTYKDPQPVHTFPETGEYLVHQVVSNSLGCTDTLSLLITVLPVTNVYIPNTFTPGYDGLNDVWRPSLSYITGYDLQVYDRWGGLVFRSQDIYQGWNGMHMASGKPVKEDSYVYVIRYTELAGDQKELRGFVNVLR